MWYVSRYLAATGAVLLYFSGIIRVDWLNRPEMTQT